MDERWLAGRAPAKVNLGLRIFPRRADGFHPIETLFCRIDLADRLRLRGRREPGVALRVGGSESATAGSDNLAARAAALLLERAAAGGGVEIELEKRVAAGTGLGGGSSDGAAVLRLLNEALPAPLPRQALFGLARQLGADVSFFLADLPLAMGRGRGDRLEPARGLEPRPMLLVIPEITVSTTAAYRLWDEGSAGAAAAEAAATPEPSAAAGAPPLSWGLVGSQATNDFEPVIFRHHPELHVLHGELRATRPLLARLTGSGAALFAVYENEARRDDAKATLKASLRRARLVSARGPV